MAESIKTQVGDLTGFASTDDNALQDWCDAGAKEIINVLPDKLKRKCSTRSTLNDSATTLDLDSKGNILHVVRLSADSGGYQKACREIEGMYGDLTNDSTDLINYATVTDPVYWITSNSSGNPTLFVKPLPTANQPAYIHHVAYPTVNMASSEIGNFPDEAQYLVVLYASCKALQRKLNDKSSDLPTFTLPVAPVPPSAPSYTTPDITTVGVASVVVSNIGTPPTYTPPTIGGATEELTTNIDGTTSNQLGNEDDWIDYSKWFQALSEMIEDDEDIELASAQIEKINSYLQSYNMAMQNKLNIFNKEGVEYQAKLQEALQQAQINAQEALQEAQISATEAQQEANLLLQKETQEYTATLSKFQAEMGRYTSELNANVQNFTTTLQKHTTDYTWLQGQYIQLRADYQQGLQMLVSEGIPQQQEERKRRR